MIEVTAAVNLPRLPRGSSAVVDETDPRVKRLIRGGYLIPHDHAATGPEEEARDDQ
jgi:hypothetical protein